MQPLFLQYNYLKLFCLSCFASLPAYRALLSFPDDYALLAFLLIIAFVLVCLIFRSLASIRFT